MHKSNTIIAEYLPTIRTTDFKEWQTVSNRRVTGKNNNLIPYSLKYYLSMESLEIRYLFADQEVYQDIKLKFKPSNLGKGEAWYMICPFSGKYSRKLVLWKGLFIHQSAIPNLHYEQQTESVAKRSSMKWIRRMHEYKFLQKEQECQYFRPIYRGLQTKKAIKINRALMRYAMALENNEEVWAWFK